MVLWIIITVNLIFVFHIKSLFFKIVIGAYKTDDKVDGS